MRKNFFLFLFTASLFFSFLEVQSQTINFTIDAAVDNGTSISETIMDGADTYILTAASSNDAQLFDLGAGDLIFFTAVDGGLPPWNVSITKNGMPTTFTLNGLDYDTVAAGNISVENQDDNTIAISASYSGNGAITITNTSNATDITSFKITPGDSDDLNDFGFHNINVTFPAPDSTAPEIQSIVRQTPTTSPTNADILSWDVTFSEAVANVDVGDFEVSGTTATVTSVTNPSGNVYRVTTSGGDLAGLNATVALSFAAGQNIADLAGNNLTNTVPTGTNENTFIVDNLGPTLAIGAPSASDTTTDPVSYTVTYTDADTVTLANGDISLNTTGDATGTIAVTGTGTATRTVTISGITGNGTIGISIAAGTASDALGNAALAVGPSGTFNVDNSAPTLAISAPSVSDTTTGPVSYTVTYTDADTVTLATGDISLNTTGDATGTIAVTGTGTATRTVTISGITGNGTIGISIAAGTASDALGNTALAAGPSATFNVDNSAPTLAISAPSISDTTAGPVSYTITYTDADTVTLATGDISLNTTGDATGTIAVTGTGTATRTVTISGITGNGTIGISIAAGTASDALGNTALAAGSSATFNVDNSAPTLAIGAPSVSDTTTGPVSYTITYTDADTVTLANGDISLNTTGDATGTIAVTGTGTTTRTVTISGITGNGTIGISIAAGTASDALGNTALAAGPSATFNVDNSAPTLAISAPSISDTTAGPVSYTMTYTDADTVTLATGDISLNTTGDATGTIAVTGTGTATRTVTISGITGNGTIGISIAAGTASDTSGNVALVAGPSATFNVDNMGPSGYTVLIDQSPINSGNTNAVSYTFTGAEVGATYNYSFSTSGGGGTVSGSGIVAAAGETIPGIDLSGLADGTITLNVILTDVNGNSGITATDTETKVTTLPTVVITSSESSPTAANPIPVMITFSQNVTDFMMAEIVVANGTVSNFSGSGNTYTVDVIPTAPGVVTVDIDANVAIGASGNGNTAAIQFSIIYDITLDEQEELLAKRVNIYPIPADNVITIASKSNLRLNNVKIFDLQGKLIIAQELDANTTTNSINVSSMESGLYLMTIHSETNSITKRVIIK